MGWDIYRRSVEGREIERKYLPEQHKIESLNHSP